VSCTRIHYELHPDTLSAAPSPSRLTSLIISVGPGVPVSSGRLTLLPPLSTRTSLTRLALALWARPSRPCHRRLGQQLALGENLSTSYGRFLHCLDLRYRLPIQTRTELAIVSTLIGCTPPLDLQVSSRYSVTATIHSRGRHPAAPSRHLMIFPRSRPSVRLRRRIALRRWRMSTPWVHE